MKKNDEEWKGRIEAKAIRMKDESECRSKVLVIPLPLLFSSSSSFSPFLAWDSWTLTLLPLFADVVLFKFLFVDYFFLSDDVGENACWCCCDVSNPVTRSLPHSNSILLPFFDFVDLTTHFLSRMPLFLLCFPSYFIVSYSTSILTQYSVFFEYISLNTFLMQIRLWYTWTSTSALTYERQVDKT